MKTKKLKPISGDPVVYNVKDGTKCHINECLDKFVETSESRTVIISTAYRGGPLMEITYDYVDHVCSCGKRMLFPMDKKKSNKNLFGTVDKIYDDIRRGVLSWDDLEQFQTDRGICFRLKRTSDEVSV